MKISKTIRDYENLHILLWLMKDTSWMMDWKLLGVTMIVPTMIVAISLVIKTFKESDLWINLAICFWITANAFWMCCDFSEHSELKNYAGFPFVFGFICVGWYYFKKLTTNI